MNKAITLTMCISAFMVPVGAMVWMNLAESETAGEFSLLDAEGRSIDDDSLNTTSILDQQISQRKAYWTHSKQKPITKGKGSGMGSWNDRTAKYQRPIGKLLYFFAPG